MPGFTYVILLKADLGMALPHIGNLSASDQDKMTSSHLLDDVPSGQAIRYTPLVLMSSGQEWQFHTASDIQWSWIDHFTMLMTSSGEELQFHTASDI